MSRTAADAIWWLQNLAKLPVVIFASALVYAAAHPDSLPDDSLLRVFEYLLSQGLGSAVLAGILMVPVAVVYLAALTLVASGWSPKRQRLAAIILSPVISSLVWRTGVQFNVDTVVFTVGIPAIYAVLLTLPRPRDEARNDEEAR